MMGVLTGFGYGVALGLLFLLAVGGTACLTSHCEVKARVSETPDVDPRD